jgi:hypothetical protein
VNSFIPKTQISGSRAQYSKEERAFQGDRFFLGFFDFFSFGWPLVG